MVHQRAEAGQLLADLPRMSAFYRLLERQPGLYDGRGATEIPFLPAALPDRALTPDDLDWQPLLSPPFAAADAFRAPADELERLRALPHEARLTCEFEATLLPGGSFLEGGRPCFGRVGLLAETRRGLVLGMDIRSGALPPGEAAGRSLVKTLLDAGRLPHRLRVRGTRLLPALGPLCEALQIRLEPAAELPALDEALDALVGHLMAGGLPG